MQRVASRLASALALLVITTAPMRAQGAASAEPVEATSLLGEPLRRPVPSGATRERMEAKLAEARRAHARTPTNADSIIWLGRRTAYLGRFNDAIAIHTDGIARHPADARLYRHRGHRYLTTRQLDRAIADFERAYALTRGTPDEVEPDGLPNARNIPTSTLQGNIRYHLGLAYYLQGRYEKALPIYREDVAASAGNPDMLVATSHWLYMTLRRLGRTDEAAAVLAPIRRDMDIIENGAYHRLLLLYKGELPVDSLLAPGGAPGTLDDVTTAYGVGNWHLYNGRRADAERIFRAILEARGQWPSFGYLAAEAEMWRRTAATPGSGGGRLPAIGLALLDSARSWCAAVDGALAPGTRVTLVFPDRGPSASWSARVVRRRATACETGFPQPSLEGHAVYDIAADQSAEGRNAPPVALLVASATSWTRGADGAVRADLDGDGLPEEARVCRAGEGQHFALWSGRTRRWRGYFDWGAFVDPTCAPVELEEAGEQEGGDR